MVEEMPSFVRELLCQLIVTQEEFEAGELCVDFEGDGNLSRSQWVSLRLICQKREAGAVIGGGILEVREGAIDAAAQMIGIGKITGVSHLIGEVEHLVEPEEGRILVANCRPRQRDEIEDAQPLMQAHRGIQERTDHGECAGEARGITAGVPNKRECLGQVTSH